jgi:hypothetical protein
MTSARVRAHDGVLWAALAHPLVWRRALYAALHCGSSSASAGTLQRITSRATRAPSPHACRRRTRPFLLLGITRVARSARSTNAETRSAGSMTSMRLLSGAALALSSLMLVRASPGLKMKTRLCGRSSAARCGGRGDQKRLRHGVNVLSMDLRRTICHLSA